MKILLFDIDSTLIECGAQVDSTGSEAMFKSVFGIDASESLIMNIGKTEKGIIEEVLLKLNPSLSADQIDIPNSAYEAWAESVRSSLKTSPPIILPGIENLLKVLLEDKNIRLGLLTGNSRLRADVKLEASNLKSFFTGNKGILTGAFGDVSNKRSDLVKEAKDKYGPGEYILIDDSLIGAKLAKDQAITSILVGTGSASIDELKEYSDFVFSDFNEDRWKKAADLIKNF